MRAALKRQLLDAASLPFKTTTPFDYHWARGKLGRDPLFAALLEQGHLRGRQRVMDLGCGRGLLAAWFLAAEQFNALKPPTGLVFEGVDLQTHACAAGNRALQAQYNTRVQLHCGDICHTRLQGFDTITLFDVLHYLSFEQQEQLLDQIRNALGPGGLLLTRVGNAGEGWRFRFSQWVDLIVGRAQGMRIRALCCRTQAQWTQALEQRGFLVQAQSMASGTPFANVLLSAQLPAAQVEFPGSTR